jgi:hypothetical protein
VWVFYSNIKTNPDGCSFIADDVTYTAPRAFLWDSGSSHTISAITPQECGGIHYSFLSWSDGGAITHTITMPDTYTANFTFALPSWDIDADHKQDISVWRPNSGIWYNTLSSAPGSFTATQWGMETDKPVPGVYDGDGKSDVAVWRPGNGVWYINLSGTPGSYTAQQWGMAEDMPISSLTGILNSIP